MQGFLIFCCALLPMKRRKSSPKRLVGRTRTSLGYLVKRSLRLGRIRNGKRVPDPLFDPLFAKDGRAVGFVCEGVESSASQTCRAPTCRAPACCHAGVGGTGLNPLRQRNPFIEAVEKIKSSFNHRIASRRGLYPFEYLRRRHIRWCLQRYEQVHLATLQKVTHAVRHIHLQTIL